VCSSDLAADDGRSGTSARQLAPVRWTVLFGTPSPSANKYQTQTEQASDSMWQPLEHRNAVPTATEQVSRNRYNLGGVKLR
jgi:hypothetical protein